MVSFKEQKEAAVTGFEGTSPQELLLIVVVAPVISYWLFCLVALDRNDHTKRAFTRTTPPTSSSSSWHLLSSILLEAVILWFPMILCQSVFLYPHGMLYLVLQLLLSVRMETSRRSRKRHNDKDAAAAKQHSVGQGSLSSSSSPTDYSYGYVTVYRCMGLYLTFVAILAVDFMALFPRRFVKTETQGYSLMDLGASFAVMAAGLCSSRARQRPYQQDSQSQQRRNESDTWKRIILHRMGPLLFMGCLRLIVHGGIEYQEHVSEYGVHWNFFFTLAMLAILPRLVSRIFGQGQHCPPSWILPLSIMVLYQYALEYASLPLHASSSSSSSYSSIANDVDPVRVVPLKLWIEEAPRSCHSRSSSSRDGSSTSFAMVVNVTGWFVCDFIVANREGLLGCIGYTSLYLMSEWIGHAFVWNSRNNNSSTAEKSTIHSRLRLLGFDLVLVWRLLVLKSTTVIGLFGLECSRRSTNAIFILWTLVVNVLVLSALQVIHDYYFYQHSNNKNGKSTNEDKKTSNITIQQSQQTRQPMSGTTILVPVVWAAVNRHGLLCFIAANLLTGILNLTIPNMLEISGVTALVILTLYLTAIGLLALLLDALFTNATAARLPAPTNDAVSTNAKAKAE